MDSVLKNNLDDLKKDLEKLKENIKQYRDEVYKNKIIDHSESLQRIETTSEDLEEVIDSLTLFISVFSTDYNDFKYKVTNILHELSDNNIKDVKALINKIDLDTPEVEDKQTNKINSKLLELIPTKGVSQAIMWFLIAFLVIFTLVIINKDAVKDTAEIQQKIVGKTK